MEPKKKNSTPKPKKQGSQQANQARRNNRTKKGKGGGAGGPGGKPKAHLPFVISEADFSASDQPVAPVPPKPDQLSINEKETLNQAFMDIKKQKEEEAHTKKKEKQKKSEERKKLTNETLKKKQEAEKKLKLEEEEKKKLIERQKSEAKRDLDELNSALAAKGQPQTTGAGTIRHKSNHNDDKLLDSFKRKTLGRGLAYLFGGNNAGHGTSSATSLRKYSSQSSLGLKSSGNLFRTISVPRVSRGQVALQDIFQKSSNDLKSPPNEPSSSRLLTQSSFRKPSMGSRLSSDYYSNQGAQKRWEEYVNTLLPSEQESIKQQKLKQKQKLEQEKLEQQKIDAQPETSSEEEEVTETNATETSVAPTEDVTATEDVSEDETDDIATDDIVSDDEETTEAPITTTKAPITKAPQQQQQQPQPINNAKQIETLRETMLRQSETKAEAKSVSDGNKIIDALKKKPNPVFLREYKPAPDEFSTMSQRPPDMVNIFKYGTVDIDFSDIFGEAEDLRGFVMWNVTQFGVEERDYEDFASLLSKECYLVLNVSEERLDSRMYNVHLSTHLGGKVNHYREEQGDESEMFLNYYFNEDFNGIKYKSGGAASDFGSGARTRQPSSLLKIDIPVIGEQSGRVNVRRVGLSAKDAKHAANDMAFILENNERVYLRIGFKASIATKNLARSLAREYVSFYGRGSRYIEVTEPLEREFFRYIKEVKTKDDRDKEYRNTEDDETIVNLYKTVVKSNGKLDLQSIADEYPIEYSMLDDDEVYILDCTTDIFVWAPTGVARKKIIAGRECAKMFYGEYERPRWARIIFCQQGLEHPHFKQQFKDWPIEDIPTPPQQTLNNYKHMSKLSKSGIIYNFDRIMSTMKEEVIQPLIENDDTDIVDVYSITLPGLEFSKLDKLEKGQFYENDCYMVIVSSRRETSYESLNSNEPTSTIYWWEGVQADSKGYASFVHGLYPIIASKFIEKGQLAPRMCYTTQRKEPVHFLNLFGGKLIIHSGSRLDEVDISDKIYQFIQAGEYTYLQQIDQEYQVEIVEHETATEKFWISLPGQKRDLINVDYRNNRFFRFSFVNSEFRVESVDRIYPSDLPSTQCALLETSEKLYIWVGERASDTLINISSIFVNFKLQFPAWDRKDVVIDPLEARQQKLAVERTLAYRKLCAEEQALLREYYEHVNRLDDEDELEDFECWAMAQKGYVADPTTPPNLEKKQRPSTSHRSSISGSGSNANGSNKTPKKKKFLGLFGRKSTA
eukprot:gene12139-14202_t